MKTKLMAALAIGALALTGCGGGSDGTSTGMVDSAGTPLSFVDVVQGDIVEPGTYHLVGASDAFVAALDAVVVPANGYAPDSMITVGGVSFRCTADNTSNCNIAVNEDGSFTTVGTIAAVLRGGTFPTTETEQLILAERARAEAERARADAEQARADAAEAARQQEQAAKEEAERQAAEAAARERAGDAQKAIAGLRSTTAAVGTVAVVPRYSAAADVSITSPTVSFSTRSRSSASGWSVTTLSGTSSTHKDDLVVYSNRGAPSRVLLTQEFPTRFEDEDDSTASSPISDEITAAASPGANDDGGRIRSGSFPTADGTDKSFTNNYDSDTTDGNTDPDMVRITGTFQGASGYFQCAATQSAACTIGRRGNRYIEVAGEWSFHATDTARALVDDKSYMYFGWWRRVQTEDGTQSFQRFRNGLSSDHAATIGSGSAFTALTGSATYRGPAAGQYAIYQPLGTQSDSGSFTASAVLTADFDSDMLSGTVSNFSNASDWSVTLNAASMEGGDVDNDTGSTGWTIGTSTSKQPGVWDATFYSEAPYVGQIPDVLVGDFTAIFDDDDSDTNGDVGRIVGAFGARK